MQALPTRPSAADVQAQLQEKLEGFRVRDREQVCAHWAHAGLALVLCSAQVACLLMTHTWHSAMYD
jgi:hypothetical protein